MDVQIVKAVLCYDGSHYKGWQIQKNGERTVQGVFQDALKKIFRKPVRVMAASRTDSGVHALGQTAHFSAKTCLSASTLKDALNDHLPKDVVVLNLKFVRKDFHARFHAKSKLYRYEIQTGRVRPVLDKATVFWYPFRLDVKRMKQAARHFVGKQDFTSFTGSGVVKENPVRTLKHLGLKVKGKRIAIEMKGNGFLYQMARKIVGTLLQVGSGKRAPEEILTILEGRNRQLSGPIAKAHGLTLVKVYY